MSKDKKEEQPSAEELLAAAKAKADEIVKNAENNANLIVEAAKKEVEQNAKSADVRAQEAGALVQKTVISVKVMAVKIGYANHRIYKPGDKFVYRYHSHDSLGRLRTQEQMLGSWMVDASDKRYGLPGDKLTKVGTVIEEVERDEVGMAVNKDADVL